MLKNILLTLITLILFSVLAEACFRIYTQFATIYDIEMHKYALHLKHASAINGLSHEHIPNKISKLMNVGVSKN